MTWTATRLKHLCSDAGQYGLNIPAEEYSATGARLIRTSDIDHGNLASEENAVYVDLRLDDRYRLREGDLLLSRSGTLGESYLVDPKGAGATYAGYLVRFRPRSGVDPRFLAYSAQSAPFQAEIAAGAVTSTIQNFNAEKYANIPLPSPPAEEQRRIADFLDAEVERTSETELRCSQLLTLLAEKREAGVTSEVTGVSQANRKESSLPWVDTLPVGWEEVKLSLVARMGSGHTPSRSHPEWWEDCRIPWVTTGEVSQIRDDRREVLRETREQISDLGIANSSAELHPPGTVVLSRTASAGFSAVMGEAMATSQDFVAWTCGPRVDNFYLLWCLRAMRSDLLGRLAMGSTHKTIYVPDLQSLRIPLPSVAEQRNIVERIRRRNAEIDRLVDVVKTQLVLLKERRQALITAAVTGQIDVSTASERGVRDGVA
jgi:type I restriction enzyme, S subunit